MGTGLVGDESGHIAWDGPPLPLTLCVVARAWNPYFIPLNGIKFVWGLQGRLIETKLFIGSPQEVPLLFLSLARLLESQRPEK